MRLPIPFLVAALAWGAATPPVAAQDLRDPQQNPMLAIHADRWDVAAAAAQHFADPVAAKLVTYYRLLAPGTATAPEIAAFMQANPDWPQQALLERRRQEAIATEPDDAVVLAQCAGSMPTHAAAVLRCADALANAGRTADAQAAARAAWVKLIGDPADEAAFLKRWAGVPTQDDQWQRFERLAWHDTIAAARQIPRLDAAHRPIAQARIALRRDDPNADKLLAALPQAALDDPGFMLDRARYLRRANRDADAAALWQQQGAAAQGAAPAHDGSFWGERNALIRQLLQDGDDKTAYALAAAHGMSDGEPMLDGEFLAGFIALRRLHQPTVAEKHFQALAAMSHSAITQGRAHYWIGRALAAEGQDPAVEYKQAAAYATTFYGQLAALALGDDPAQLAARINALHDPVASRENVFAFTGHEIVRAAALLVAWGDARRARPFLLRMDEIAPIPAERALVARLALQVGLPDMAVAVARRIGRDGGMLAQAGWPAPYDPPGPLDAAVSLGIMRQESSFDIGAVSPSGALGLMQLLPTTAQEVAKRLGQPIPVRTLTVNAENNMTLGTSYLQQMLDRFGGSLPLAIAAYNGGPHRVDQWLAQNGDPRVGPIDMLDWIELIPYGETRNYVQRVLENIVIYRCRLGAPSPTLLAQWTP